MAQNNNQLRQAFVEEITEVLIRLLHQGYTLREIEQVALEHFERRKQPSETSNEYLRRKFGI